MEIKGVKAFIEYKLERPGKEPDIPDIFVLTEESYSFLEEKSSLPRDRDKLELEVGNVRRYASKHRFEHETFTPQVILLCPSDIYKQRAPELKKHGKDLCIVVYPYPLEDPIVLKRVQGSISDSKLTPLLTGVEAVPHARAIVPSMKFLRKDPPVPYSAWLVWQVVWSYATSTKEDFRVKYSTILEKCRAFYPGWLARDTEQITQGRLNDGLELLAFMEWIEFEGKLGPSSEIQAHYSKGDRIRQEALEYLVLNYIRMLVKKAKPVKKKRAPRLRKVTRMQPSPKDDKLDSYLGGASARDKKKAGKASS